MDKVMKDENTGLELRVKKTKEGKFFLPPMERYKLYLELKKRKEANFSLEILPLSVGSGKVVATVIARDKNGEMLSFATSWRSFSKEDVNSYTADNAIQAAIQILLRRMGIKASFEADLNKDVEIDELEEMKVSFETKLAEITDDEDEREVIIGTIEKKLGDKRQEEWTMDDYKKAIEILNRLAERI